jgi:hypothetical protein
MPRSTSTMYRLQYYNPINLKPCEEKLLLGKNQGSTEFVTV